MFKGASIRNRLLYDNDRRIRDGHFYGAPGVAGFRRFQLPLSVAKIWLTTKETNIDKIEVIELASNRVLIEFSL